SAKLNEARLNSGGIPSSSSGGSSFLGKMGNALLNTGSKAFDVAVDKGSKFIGSKAELGGNIAKGIGGLGNLFGSKAQPNVNSGFPNNFLNDKKIIGTNNFNPINNEVFKKTQRNNNKKNKFNEVNAK